MKFIKSLFGALALACIVFQNASATTVFPIATNLSFFEISSGTTFDGTNYLVGMEIGTNVVGQLVSSNGTLLGSQIIVGSNPGDLPPSIGLAFGQTNYLLAWSDNSVNSGVDMFGQFISRNGAKVGSKFKLLSSVGSHNFQYVVALASDGTNFLVVWVDGYNSDTQTGGNFYGQLVAPAGTLSGSEFLISSQLQNGNAAAAIFGKTNYLVVWQSNNNDTGLDNKTYGEFVSSGGSAGSPFQINQTDSEDQSQLAVAFDQTNYFVVWNWDPPPETEESVTNWDLYGRLVSQTGTFPGSELHLVTDVGSQQIPAVAFDGANYLLTWNDMHWNSDGSLNTTNFNIHFQYFNGSGSAIGPEFASLPSQGTNSPFLALNGLIFDGTRFAMAATLATLQSDAQGNITNIPSSEVYGAFIPSSTASPTLTASNLVGTQFPLQLIGTPGINYAIQISTNLALSNWTAVVTNSPTNGTFSFTDTHATNASRFYRAVKQ
jgi:hypothetical protein